MVQSYQRGVTPPMVRPEEPPQKVSGFYQRGTAVDGGWGFILPRESGAIDVVAARNCAVIGSGEDADVRIEGSGVAPQHARIDVRADGVYLEDLDSPGGTFVGGVRARRMGIAHGDVVRFGNQLAVFAERGLSNCEGQLDLAEEIVIGPRDRAAFVEPALEYARAGQSFAIEGGPGLGKRTLAKLAAREREASGAVLVIDSLAPPADIFAEAQGERPKTFLLLSAERLTRPLQTEIVQMLARAPGAIAIATFDISLDRAVGDGLVAPSFAALTNSRKLVVPPLSARRENIPGIVRALARKLHIDPSRLSVEFIERLVRADWPAGIPEIEEVLRETAATSEGVLDAKSISRPLTRPPSSYPSPPAADDPALARERLVDALAKAGGSIASAARTLGMSRQAVYREAQRLGLEVGKRRSPAKNH